MLLRNKIIFQVVMTGVLLLLVGCSNKEGKTSNNKEDVEVSQDNVNEIENKHINEAVQDNQNPTEDVSVSDEDVVEPEEISLSVDVNSINPEEAYEGLYSCEYPTITVASEEYAGLSSALENVNEIIKNEAVTNVDDFKDSINQCADLSTLPEKPYSIEISADISRSDSSIISIETITHVEIYRYHPKYEIDTYNINPMDGSIYEIEDVIDLNDNLYSILSSKIKSEFSDVSFRSEVDLENDIKNYFENEEEFVKKYYYKKFGFYIDDENVYFVMGGLDISDDIGGDIKVTLSIEEIRDFLKIKL
ncbi:hypothetical protein [Pseudobutyrivibrio sp.]|uniref:hypothetical protein n=1 Tax=Pseudobutyrivibrio sp. TaxID=2014367 RepID=UPI001DA35B99|nr:hypothetical protein [Pseudobutyrivibrio sp.]MBE5910379.1 hypothetical protein [Pseudobutyrivibrio sp.]